METLRQKQSRFVEMLGDLIREAKIQGFELTLGESYRSDEQAAINALGPSGRATLAMVAAQNHLLADFVNSVKNNPKEGNGIKNSLHTLRLAQDFNIFRDGQLVNAEVITPLGEYWERIGGTWGGRFRDPSHFSLEHNGVK